MKKAIIPLIIPVIILSCKKDDDVNPADVRLLKIDNLNDVGDVVSAVSFDYNQQGQITSLSLTNTAGSSLVATISYTGSSEIIISPVPIHDDALDAVFQIHYFIDALGKPQKRIEVNTLFYKAPINIPQNTYENDTTSYEYNSDGLVSKTTCRRRDSTWFNPGSVQTNVTYTSYTANYTNTGNNLTQIVKTGTEKSTTVNINGSFNYSSGIRDTYDFDYSKGYTNQTDFTNATILSEFSSLTDRIYPLNKAYSNFPDQLSYSNVRTNLATGQVTTSNGVINTAVGYNRYGFISSFNYGTGINPKKLLYNK